MLHSVETTLDAVMEAVLTVGVDDLLRAVCRSRRILCRRLHRADEIPRDIALREALYKHPRPGLWDGAVCRDSPSPGK